ncbi:hypothetical protein OG521_00175 [Streptomyces sp. NBC_01463]
MELEVDDDATTPSVIGAADPDGVGPVALAGAEHDDVRLWIRTGQFDGEMAVEGYEQVFVQCA